MHIVHIALGGCLKAPPVHYGVTGDTGGHIAYILGAVEALAARDDVASVDVVTRAFRVDSLGHDYARPVERLGPKSRIVRLSTSSNAYLEKESLAAEIPALSRAFLDWIAALDRKPDAIHAHFADAARLAMAAKARFGIPFVYTPHSLGIDKRACGLTGPALKARIASEGEAIAQADAIVGSSRDEAERQVPAYGIGAAGRTHCVPPGIHLPAAGPRDRAQARLRPFLRDMTRPQVLAIARPVAKKNLPGLIDAFGRHDGLRDTANLVILAGQRDDVEGGTPEQTRVLRQMVDAIDRHDLWGKVAIPRRHDPQDVASLYRMTAEGRGVFANPALFEPFGLTVLEAARFGLPVVATDKGGPSEILPRIGHGRLVDPRNPDEVGQACFDLISDDGAWTKASEAALRNVGLYSWGNWATAVRRLYASLRSTPPKPVRAPKSILASDIDGTLTGSRAGVRLFSEWASDRGRARCLFAVATGRSIGEARRVLAKWRLPLPDLFITSVGTEIWRHGASGLVLCQDYAADLQRTWPRDDIADALSRIGLVPQAPFEQRPWKLSYVGTVSDSARAEAALREVGLVARVVPSHGRFIDVLPIRAGKARAVAFEAARQGLALSDCIGAGDSGNDRDMLEQCGRAILPANALDEIADLLTSDRLLRTRESHASGVVEGLEALGLVPQRIRA